MNERRVVRGLFWIGRVVLYAAVLLHAELLSTQLRGEYFPGGLYWAGPVLAVAVPVVLTGLHLYLTRRRSKRAWLVTVGLGMTLIAWHLLVWTHLIAYVWPRRIAECGVYESECTPERTATYQERLEDPKLEF